MGRPTDEKKDKTIKLRLSEELYERLEKESEGNMSEYVRGILSGKNKGKDERPKGVEIPEGTYRNLEEMCMASGLTMGRFMEYVKNLFHEGKIYIDGLTVKTKGEYDLAYLIESCHRVNVDPQEMINKLAASLNR